MNILIVSNTVEMKGLYKDALVLAQLLDTLHHNVMLVDFRDDLRIDADLVIFLEVVVPEFLECAPRRWWIPNPEWSKPQYLQHLDCFDRVLCKTRDAERIFSNLTEKALFTGFTCEDHYDPTVTRERVFFHACRGTIAKQTEVVKAAFQDLPYPLAIADNLPEDEFRQMQNRCLFLIAPSSYEGYGMLLNEGLSCGQIVITTNIPPMSEMAGVAKLINPVTVGKQELAEIAYVAPEGVRRAARWAWELDERAIQTLSAQARQSYLDEAQAFRTRFSELVNELEVSRV